MTARFLSGAGEQAANVGGRTDIQTGGDVGETAKSASPRCHRRRFQDDHRRGPVLSNRLTLEETAVNAELRRRQIPLTAGDATGSRIAKTVEHKME